MISNVKLVTWH